MRVTDKLCRELGTYKTPELPEDTGQPGWSKHFPCLFCGGDGKKTAAINYRIDFYKCFRCGRDVSSGSFRDWSGRIVPAGTDPVSRFRAQIGQAARNIRVKYGEWTPEWEAREYARLRVLIYAGPPDLRDADAGKLPVWEDKAQFDLNELDRFVLQALNCDLMDWAKGRVRKGRYEEGRTSLNRPVYGDSDDDDTEEEAGDRYSPDIQIDGKAFPTKRVKDADSSFLDSRYPYLRAVYVDGMTVEEVARTLHVSPRTVQRRMAEETATIASKVKVR